MSARKKPAITIELMNLAILEPEPQAKPGRKASAETARAKEEFNPEKIYLCDSARSTMYISPDGTILPCMLLAGMPAEKNFPHYYEKTIAQTLQDSAYLQFIHLNFQDFLDHNPDCKLCRYQRDCLGGCRAIALKENENGLFDIDPKRHLYFIEGWHERFEQALKSDP